MFDICDDEIGSGIFSEENESFSGIVHGMFFSDDSYYQSSEQVVVSQEALQNLQSSCLDPSLLTEEPSPSLSPSSSGEVKTGSEGSVSESVSSQSSPNSDIYASADHLSGPSAVNESESSSASDSDSDSSSDSDSDSDHEETPKQRYRKVPAKRRRVAKSEGPSVPSEKKPRAPRGGATKHRPKKLLPPPTDPALPKGYALPAILGGSMPAPLRRKRRKDMTEEEMKRKEEAGIPDSEDSDSEERRLVRLPRETLLVMTSAQIGQYIRYLRATHSLSRGQIEELRRQKRLVKNRESAKTSRKKREALVSELQESITELKNSVEVLKKDNERLANENIRLRNVLKMRDPALFDTLLRDPDAAAAGKMFDADAATSQDASRGRSGHPSVRVASLVFFFIVFCFALLAKISVSQTQGATTVGLSETVPRNSWRREVIPEVSNRYSKSKPWFTSPQVSKGRVINPADGSEHIRSHQQKYKLPDIELSGSWHDMRSGLTIRRPSQWAPEDNLTYLYVAPDSCFSQMNAASEQFSKLENKGLSFSMVVPLSSIRPSCGMSTPGEPSKEDDVFVDVRCSIEEISIIPGNVDILGNNLG